jgi:hypothetical protein
MGKRVLPRSGSFVRGLVAAADRNPVRHKDNEDKDE